MNLPPMRMNLVSVPLRGIGSEKPQGKTLREISTIVNLVSVPLRGIGSEKRYY